MWVRQAEPGDEQTLRCLRLEALSDSPDAFGSTIERELARTLEDWRGWMSPGVTFILESAGEPRGIVAGRQNEQRSSVIHLLAMWVHPDARGGAGGDALVRAVLEWARARGAQVVRLHVIEDNFRARRFYDRLGFRLTGRTHIRERDGRLELEMEQSLHPTTKAK